MRITISLHIPVYHSAYVDVYIDLQISGHFIFALIGRSSPQFLMFVS